MRTLRETYMDLIYMGSRKRQDLLSKLGAWGLCGRVEGQRGEAERGTKKNVELNKNQKERMIWELILYLYHGFRGSNSGCQTCKASIVTH